MTRPRLRFVSDDTPPAAAPLRPQADDSDALDAFSNAVIHVADALRPAVVNLHGTRGRGGAGSGVMFSPDGFLLTNLHVIRGQDRVRVRVSDGQGWGGRVGAPDPWTVLAAGRAAAGP